ncbi:MAG: hypothetical protein IJ376_03630 [Acidaminococcaceae bacterium]|nr:hypothetical protein [Acidaminococcaceae bacterium]
MEEVIADKSVEWQQILEQAFSVLHQAKEAEGDQALQQVSLLGCIGLKTGRLSEAQACFEELLAVGSSKGSAFCYLVCVKNMLVMAARTRNGELFMEWLLASEIRLQQALLQVEQSKAVDFVIALTFIVCDRRYLACLPVLQNLVGRLINAITDKKLVQVLFNEWTSLIAQMARRKWDEVNKFLLGVLLKALLKKKDLQLMKLTLLQLNMHLQMYSRWDGFEKAFVSYKELQYFYLLLLKRAGKLRFDEGLRQQYLVIVLRSVREWIANVARVGMQDDLDIIRQWQELLKKYLTAGVQSWVDLLVQLEIAYWNLTKPKTSRKQLEYLADLLEPNVVTEEYNTLLKRIV